MGQVVLVGAGHAHLSVIAGARRYVAAGHEVTVISPDDFWYSGMAAGVIGGRHPLEADRIDVAALAARAGATMVRQRVTRVDAERRTVHLDDDTQLGYDALSLDVGSVVRRSVPGAERHAVPVKPLRELCALTERLGEAWPSRGPRRIVVVGGGPSGCEVAGNLAGRAEAAGTRVEITIITRRKRILDLLPKRAAEHVGREFAARGITIHARKAVTQVLPKAVELRDGTIHVADLVVWATGLYPAPLMRESELEVDADGALIVDSSLATRTHPEILAAGDCVAFRGRGLPMLGVYAVREARVIAGNIAAVLGDGPWWRYLPQPRALMILNLGAGRALAVRGRRWWCGRASHLLKERIDRRWMARYRA